MALPRNAVLCFAAKEFSERLGSQVTVTFTEAEFFESESIDNSSADAYTSYFYRSVHDAMVTRADGFTHLL
jgi:hypothetical protein